MAREGSAVPVASELPGDARERNPALTAAGRDEYPNPPIEEALCQFDFASPVRGWSVASPGLVFDRIQSEYPAPPEGQEQLQASIEVLGEPATSASTNIAMNRGPQRFLYRDTSRTRVLMVNESFVSVNSLRPYEGWPTLKGRLVLALQLLSEVIGEVTVKQVAIRYINRIVIDASIDSDTDTYFNVPIHAVGERASIVSFIHRVQSMLPDGSTQAISTFASLEGGEVNQVPFLLDLEFKRAFLEPISLDEALAQADDLKRLENAEFEACITDVTRKLFV